MTQPVQQVHDLLAQVKELSSQLSSAERGQIQHSVLSVLSQLETPYEYMLRLSRSHLQLACIRVGVDTGLFRALVNSSSPISSGNLSEKTGIAPDLLGRLLRFLASVGVVQQTAVDEFSAETITLDLAKPALESGVHLLFDIHNKTFQAMPDFLDKHSYSEVNDVTKGIFQDAFTTSLSCYEYLAQNSKLQGYMQEAMSLQKPEGDWASALRINEAVQSWSISEPTRVLFVDIGGGLGHQCIRMRETYPNIAGRVILQDMPITIGRLTKPMPHGIEAMEHNFDNLQPIKNAKFYYVRNVLHGLPDSNCITMLKKIAPSMHAESVLVIDDIVIPDIGARSQACQLDFIMMASIAGMKRTRQQWHTLLKAAGLNVMEIRTYSEPLQDSLILASLAC